MTNYLVKIKKYDEDEKLNGKILKVTGIDDNWYYLDYGDETIKIPLKNGELWIKNGQDTYTRKK